MVIKKFPCEIEFFQRNSSFFKLRMQYAVDSIFENESDNETKFK